MNSKTTFLVWTILVVVSFTLVVGKSLENPELDIFRQNQLEYPPEETLENALVRYLLTKEWLTRARQPIIDVDDKQRKRSYWKQCAFNAVSCFGK